MHLTWIIDCLKSDPRELRTFPDIPCAQTCREALTPAQKC